MTTHDIHEREAFIQQNGKKIPGLRYVLFILASLISAIGISCTFAFNFASTCAQNSTTDAKWIYELNPSNSPIMYFERNVLKWNYSAYPIGMLLGLILQILWKRYYLLSTRWLVTVGNGVSSLITLMIPIFYDYYPQTTLVLKIIQGFFLATMVPLTAQITSTWSPRNQLGLFVAIMSAYSQIGLFTVMLSSGPMCELFGWRGIFYAMGLASTIITVLWMLLYRDSPKDHPYLSDKELTIIRGSSILNTDENLDKNKRKLIKTATPPYAKMFTDKSVLACLIACAANFGGISTIIISFTLILKIGLGLTDLQTSIVISSSSAMQLITKLISGKLSDELKLSETTKVVLFNSLSLGLCGALMILAAILPLDYKALIVIVIGVFHGVIGFNAAGFNKAYILVAKQHSSVMFTCNGLILNVLTLIVPFFSFYVAPNSSWTQWRKLLLFHGAVIFIGNLLFCILIDAKPANFTQCEEIEKSQNGESKL